MPACFVKNTIRKLREKVGICSGDDEIIIESHDSIGALWGELFAKELSAKHFFAALNEQFRSPRSYYEEAVDFYQFKFKRGELLSSYSAAQRLFDGYKKVCEDDVREIIIDEDPIQDYYNVDVESIKRKEWNICYIGRGEKPYVLNTLLGIGEFCKKYPERDIQFVNVGSACQVNPKIINKIKQENANLKIVDLGNQTPLPRSLYSKIDVVLAGSGSARCSVEEGALTLVLDTDSCMCNGLLGYETFDSIYKSDVCVESSVSEALERVFVYKVQENLTYNYPPKKGVEFCTQQNFEVMSLASEKKEYYDVTRIYQGFDVILCARYVCSLLKRFIYKNI
jgi:hypothetical protein